MNTRTEHASTGWDSLPDAIQDPLPQDHPWPESKLCTLRIYSVPLQSERLALSVGHLKPGEAIEHHNHAETEEIYFLMQGEAQINIEGKVIDARRFDAFRLDPDVRRSVYNNSDQDCYWLFAGAPAEELVEWIAQLEEQAVTEDR